ncbi:hypothetical protein GNI_155800 [Gregarina niphandrodes]|uniref:Uncharacterized protein n=1 Tax=Gregarina niphandrodes TaxID=110365 RepID=A0A023B044_GRENI|nr:hypothetical protein GNI_155800 [Gregarina niphandrodes]EZG43938.1 hypothetical protein GNI_155800 [Gregarina niphandrodes]|eukprot:XP_011132909.1 hypothetical protein GNI_155800 [Gregarina niphandrodes]
MVEVGEKVVHTILTKERDDLCTSYQPCSVALSSSVKSIVDLTDSQKAQAMALANARTGVKAEETSSSNKRGAPDSSHMMSFSEQVEQSFDVPINEKKILTLCKKPSGVTITKVRDVIPDAELQGVQYATGILTLPGHKLPTGSFAVTSTSSSEACYYEPCKPPQGVQLDEGDIYAVPKSILIVQKMSTQAPKKWLCIRSSKQHPGTLLATELDDLRFQITKDSSMDASNNATVIISTREE